MIIEVKTINGESVTLDNITELVFNQELDAPCDSLLVRFKSDKAMDEIVEVRGYEEDRLFFFGYCDYQKMTLDCNGSEGYIYARSSICRLVDNQCQPYTFSKPTARQLYVSFARAYGFENAMPEIVCNEKYQVQIGTSCYGAINSFVHLITGSCLRATPDNRLVVLSCSDNVRQLEKYKILSAAAQINRSEPLSQINFKRLQGDEYDLHTKSILAQNNGISKSAYVNLAALPQWQREYTIKQRLKASFDEYYLLEVEISGFADDDLLQRFNYYSDIGVFENYALIRKKCTLDKNGTRTRLVLRKIIDEGELTYVD